MENANVVNDTQGPSVEARTQSKTRENGEKAQPARAADPARQTPQENAAFAAMRREKEAAEKQARQLKSENEALLLERDAPPAADGGQSAAMRELEQLRRWRDEKIIEEDIARIRDAYPDFSAKSAADLPQQFLRIMATGNVDALTAYDICVMQQRRVKKDPPPDPGALENSSTREKDYYTPEEVDRLTQRDFKNNPRLLEIVQRSMTKWR